MYLIQLESCHYNVNDREGEREGEIFHGRETFNSFVRFSTLSKNVIMIRFMTMWVLSGRMTVLTK